MHSDRGHRLRHLTLAAILSIAVANGAAHAQQPDVEEELEPASTPLESPLLVTEVRSAQSCGGEWTVSALASNPDGTVMALIGTDEDFAIGIGPDGVTVSRLSNCTLNLTTQVVEGLSYALTKVSFEGRAVLDEGVVAEQSLAYGFAGGPTSPRVSSSLVGPYEGGTVLDEAFPADQLAWSSCQEPRPLQIRSSLALKNSEPQRSGLLSMSLTSGVLMLVLEFATRPCALPDV